MSVSKFRQTIKSVLHFIFVAVGWFLLATIPIILLVLIKLIYVGLSHSEMSPNVLYWLTELAAWSFIGIILSPLFIRGRVLIKQLGTESVWYLVVIAIGWLILAPAPSFLIGFIRGLNLGLQLPDMSSNVINLLSYVIIPWIWVTLLLADLIGGRIVGHGNIRLGLGYEPISNLPIVGLMAAVIAVYATLVNITLYQTRPDLLAKAFIDAGNPWIKLYAVLYAVVLAPLSEELFFRGWLWMGLRKHWPFLPTAVLTSVFWLALHLGNGIVAPIVLLPVAAILAIVRDFGRSVRASIALHTVYNAIVLISPWALKWSELR